jgi:hypothetical protein
MFMGRGFLAAASHILPATHAGMRVASPEPPLFSIPAHMQGPAYVLRHPMHIQPGCWVRQGAVTLQCGCGCSWAVAGTVSTQHPPAHVPGWRG